MEVPFSPKLIQVSSKISINSLLAKMAASGHLENLVISDVIARGELVDIELENLLK